VGLWILAAAAILSLVSQVAFSIEMKLSGGKPSEVLDLLLISYPTLLVWLLVFVGCFVLALTGPKKTNQ